MLSTWLLLQWAASAFAFCPQAWGQPRASSPSPLALPRVSTAPQANGIKITSFNSAEARAAARREAAQAAQPPLPPPDPEVHAVQAVPQQANPPSVPMPPAWAALYLWIKQSTTFWSPYSRMANHCGPSRVIQ